MRHSLPTLTLGITAGTLQSDFIPVVFSPGATSFGMFQNEFHRGDSFRELVKNIFQGRVQDNFPTPTDLSLVS